MTAPHKDPHNDMVRRHLGVSLVVVMAFALVSVAPAFAQQGDEEPSRRRHGATPDLQPALEVPPPPPALRAPPPVMAPPKGTVQPVPPPPLPDKTPPKKAAQPVVPPPPLPDKTPPKKTVRPVTPPPPVAAKKKKVPPVVKPAMETRTARLLRQGREYLAAKQLTTPAGRSALDRFQQVLVIDPGNRDAKAGIAKIATTYRSWGDKALKNKEPVKAERYLMKSAEIDGGNAATYAFLGYARLDQKKYQGALAAFRKALEISPGTADYYTGIGVTEFQKKDYPAAIKAFERVVAKRPHHAGTHRLIAIANERLGNWRAAVDAYGRAYKIKPKPDTDDLALGRLHVRLKEYALAVPYLKRAAKHAPNDPVVFDHLATAHHFLNNIPEALAAVKTRNRLEKAAPKRSGKTTPEPAGKQLANRPGAGASSSPSSSSGRGKPPPSAIAEAHASFKAGRLATAYFQFKALAKNGNSEAAYMLGRMRHQGIKVRKDLKRAFGWYLQAARAGHAGGQAGIGYMYYRGLGGVRRDHARAAQWFEKAAKGGITGAMARLARMYERGDGVQRNSRTASYWYIMAARRGNRAARKRLRELGTSPKSTSFSGPDEIESGLGEMPALSTPTAPVTTAIPTPAPAPAPKRKSRPCGGGLLGGLTCAGK
ncbi:MAG: tetratricopeptide repeat protein [Alphaproteobacteria bacterium]